MKMLSASSASFSDSAHRRRLRKEISCARSASYFSAAESLSPSSQVRKELNDSKLSSLLILMRDLCRNSSRAPSLPEGQVLGEAASPAGKGLNPSLTLHQRYTP